VDGSRVDAPVAALRDIIVRGKRPDRPAKRLKYYMMRKGG
jgi:hypothetical protein